MNKIQFKDYASIRTAPIPKDVQTKYVDQILKDLSTDDPEVIKGLEVRITTTHAARLTGHWHYYSPGKLKDAVKSFTEPFKKPILIHHDMQSDPIGRTQIASYISTPNPIVPASIIDQANKNVKHTKDSLQYIKKLKPFLYDRSFSGLGYITQVARITDPDAIAKVIDGRYHTVSVSYDTDTLHCSECYQDWIADGLCDHEKGQLYKSGKMFLIFGDKIYSETSYVNEPADELAGNESIKKLVIPVMLDTRNKLKGVASRNKRANIITNALATDSLLISDPSRVAMVDMGLYYHDSKNDLHLPISNDTYQNNQGDKMKLSELITLGPKGFYDKLKEKLPEGKAVSDEDFEKLTDEIFVGANKTFPAMDAEHIDACRQMLAEVEDSDEKTEILSFLSTREDSFKLPVEDAQPVVTEPVVEKNDFIVYSFKLEGENWGQPDPENPNTETEKAILALLMSLYTQEAKDYFISKFKDSEEKDKLEFINGLADALISKELLISQKDSQDKIAELDATVANQRKEYNILKDSKKTSDELLNKYVTELKDNFVSKIIQFKSKENPGEDALNQEMEFFKDKSLSEVRTALQVLERFTDTAKEVSVVMDPTVNIQRTLTEIELNTYVANLEKAADGIGREYGSVAKQAFIDSKKEEIDKLKKQLIKKD